MKHPVKTLYLILFAFLFFSCNKNHSDLPSSLTELNYPKGTGQSGDSITGVVGYGYDATGICDTLSVKAKVLTLHFPGQLYLAKPNTAGVETVGGRDYNYLLNNMEKFPNRVGESDTALLSHIRSLIKIGLNTDSFDRSCSYAYYSYNLAYTHARYYLSDTESELTDDFKTDVGSLTPEALVKKYGTHVIVEAYTGCKFEVLYKCDLNEFATSDEMMSLLYKRLAEFFEGVSGIILSETNNIAPKNEQLIFNTLGYDTKLFGLIDATDNNSNQVSIDLNSIRSNSPHYQFVKIGKDGLLPLYELISDPVKKQAVKDYINTYISFL